MTGAKVAMRIVITRWIFGIPRVVAGIAMVLLIQHMQAYIMSIRISVV